LSADSAVTVFGFAAATFDLPGPAASGSFDFNDSGGAVAGWRMLRVERGVGLGGGVAAEPRTTITYASPSINDVVEYFSN
ncbi:MAG: hypothetical protein COA42_13990, partial [Alteromonadaceae bacterium]